MSLSSFVVSKVNSMLLLIDREAGLCARHFPKTSVHQGDLLVVNGENRAVMYEMLAKNTYAAID